MTARARRVFRWWTPSADDVRLRRRELEDRVWWQVLVRWVFVAIGAAFTLVVASGALPVHVDAALLGGCTVALALTNVIYTLLAGPVKGRRLGRFTPRAFLLTQSTTDFAVLGGLSYTLGIIETPMAALYLAHISLLTLHCQARRSLYMTLLAATFASAPIVLTSLGLLPPQTILGSDLPARLAANGTLGTTYVLGLYAIFVTCWYLVAQIANSLRMRERRLQDDHDRLAKLSEQKVRATLRATHELKAPLAAIKSYVYTMRDGYTGELAPGTRAVVLRIGERCDLLMTRISQIIHLANLKTLEQHDVKFERLDLGRVLAEEVDEAAIMGRQRKIRVRWQGARPAEAPIMASEPELRTLLSNLLSNAVQYSHEGGEVSVSLRRDEAGVHCAIADHGIGIPAECIDRIYEDHFRTDHAVRHRPNGSGLGMAIVAEVVRLHEAQLEVASQLEVGTTMTLTFPAPEHFGTRPLPGDLTPNSVHSHGDPNGPHPADR